MRRVFLERQGDPQKDRRQNVQTTRRTRSLGGIAANRTPLPPNERSDVASFRRSTPERKIDEEDDFEIIHGVATWPLAAKRRPTRPSRERSVVGAVQFVERRSLDDVSRAQQQYQTRGSRGKTAFVGQSPVVPRTRRSSLEAWRPTGE
eukprot:CAMPEP_0118898010 /NCGR_PEP_ID=MMETSP1166-20130328/5175_1 /TAXON_ID=1104430 /ORGANISM="Chrysoreinhardia sp, Strain CCMP3193" /LENGTH=147 /DNA_ID=CAMNT_0006837089 /DNA_START=270 /DNA_END=713 /DNA_ORIENTATION=+